jgi:hypothetical protein
MSYILHKTYKNDYRCCCTTYWGETVTVPSLDEALDLFSKEPLWEKEYGGLYSMTITKMADEDDDDVLVRGELCWIPERIKAHKLSRWDVTIKDFGTFSTICKGVDGKEILADLTWDEAVARLI